MRFNNMTKYNDKKSNHLDKILIAMVCAAAVYFLIDFLFRFALILFGFIKDRWWLLAIIPVVLLIVRKFRKKKKKK